MTTVQRVLADYMSELSEYRWYVGWVDGLEYWLWEDVVDFQDCVPLPTMCHCHFDLCPICRLINLSEACGGWIVWDEEKNEETWVPMADWTMQYEEHLKTKRQA